MAFARRLWGRDRALLPRGLIAPVAGIRLNGPAFIVAGIGYRFFVELWLFIRNMELAGCIVAGVLIFLVAVWIFERWPGRGDF